MGRRNNLSTTFRQQGALHKFRRRIFFIQNVYQVPGIQYANKGPSKQIRQQKLRQQASPTKSSRWGGQSSPSNEASQHGPSNKKNSFKQNPSNKACRKKPVKHRSSTTSVNRIRQNARQQIPSTESVNKSPVNKSPSTKPVTPNVRPQSPSTPSAKTKISSTTSVKHGTTT